MGGKKRAKQFFQKHKFSASKKCWEKIVRKKCEKCFFLNSQEYRDQKRGGTKCARQFFQKHTISANKKYLEKIVEKKCEKRFFVFTRISFPKNGGEKRAKQFFQNHKISAI